MKYIINDKAYEGKKLTIKQDYINKTMGIIIVDGQVFEAFHDKATISTLENEKNENIKSL